MITRIPCIGDAHLHPGERQPDRLKALDQVVGECRQLENVGGWVIAGDLFHQRSTIEDRNAWAERLVVMANIAPVFICDGNHDMPGDTAIFAKLKAKWPVYVFARPHVIRVELATSQRLTLFALPYPSAATLVGDGVAPADVVGTARMHLDAIFIDAGARLEAARTAGDLTLFMGHVNVSGSIVSTGQPQIGQEIEIDEALLLRLGDCPKIVNHIHKAQEIGGAHYPGSICRLNWGEIEEKGYLVVEFDESADVPAWRVLWHPIDVPAMYHVEAVYEDGDFTYDIDPRTIPPKSEVRVRVRFPQSERKFYELGKAHLLADFAEVGRLAIEPVCVPDRALRSPEVAKAETTFDKLVAWCQVNNVDVPEGLEEALGALEQFEPDLVLAAFKERIEAIVSPQAESEEPQEVTQCR